MSSFRRVAAQVAAALTFAFLPASALLAQCVSLTTLGSAATQNFDTLSNVAGSTTNNLTITGWFLTESGGGARDNEQYAVDTGGSNSGDTFSYGSAAATDRALGGLQTGTLIPVIGACYTNNTGATITSISIAYTGEQWRIGNTAAARDDRIDFQFSTTATSLTTGTWTDVDALDFTNPVKTNAVAGALDGNAAANRSAIGAAIASQSIANGATFWVRWNDLNASGADDGLAIDDFSLTPSGGVVQPDLTINNLTLAEGNGGTSTASFTVSLSAPAGAGGVSFDIATADGTATSGSDYAPGSATGQTIAAGASSSVFNVLVNGDLTAEASETFLVNVTNVSGATVLDGQGQGTITNDDAANIVIDDVSLAEGSSGSTTFNFSISLQGGVLAGADGVGVSVNTADGSTNPATAGSDYSAVVGGTATIAAGTNSTTVGVSVAGDATFEPDETFFVNLSAATGSFGSPTLVDAQGLGTIVNDDTAALPVLNVGNATIAEGDAGTAVLNLTVTASGSPTGDITATASTADGTATAGSDYVALTNQIVSIPAASFSGTPATATVQVPVTINGDAVFESGETFTLSLANPVNAVIANGTATATITNDDAPPVVSIANASVTEGNSGTTALSFSVTATGSTALDITVRTDTTNGSATAPGDYTALVNQTLSIPAASFSGGSATTQVTVQVVGDTSVESNEEFSVTLTTPANASLGTSSAVGTIVNDDVPTRIHAVQGSGAATPISGQTVTIEGIVVGSYQTQGSGQLRGFFVQEEDADTDADPQTSEGIFVFCNTCPTAVAEGQRVQVTGATSEFFNMTQLTASSAGSVVVVDAGNNLALATPVPIDLPLTGDAAANEAFYEAREGMRVRFTDVLVVSEYSDLGRFGQLTLFEGGRPFQFTEDNVPSAAGYAAHLASLATRRVILDDTNNADNGAIAAPDDGTQRVYHPVANGGLSTGTQGTDFFRGGDTVANLTGVLHWSFAGGSSPNAWRIRPTLSTPATFTAVNTRPASAPNPTGLIKVASANVLNFFTTIDTTSSNNTGTCGATAGGGVGTLDCRGADSAAELARQRDRTTTALCGLDADLLGLVEVENTPNSNVLTTLRDDLNSRCGGGNPWAIAGTDGTIGTDAIRVAQLYRTGRLNPVGAPLFDADAIHNRPPMAQAYELVGGPQAGQRFTAVVNHLKSKGSCPASGDPNADQNDGQACWALERTQQATRTLAWVSNTVIPAAGNDPDVLLLGDFNSYGSEAPVQAIRSAGYIDLLTFFDPDGYSYLFDGQLGHLDYVFASASLGLQVMGAASWHVNADEIPLFDYNDDIRDTGESAFEEEPNGAARVPPRLLFDAQTPFRASDHDPVVVGLFGLPPTSTAIADRTSLIDVPIEGVSFTIADPDGTVTCAANVTATSSNAALVSNANVQISGSAQSCTLRVVPSAGATGTTVITVRVTDSQGLSTEVSFNASFVQELVFRDGFEPAG